MLQGFNEKDSKQWWDAVKKYRFDGWALAGSVGWSGGLDSVLRNVLMMRDEGAFEEGQDWLHVLGVSQPTWAVLLSAMQMQLKKVNPKLRISYDSASPFQSVGKYHDIVRYPKLGTDLRTWVMSASESPINPMYANTNGKYRFPYSSPVGDLLTLDHLSVNGGQYQKTAADHVSWLLLINHTLYVYVRAFLEANDMAFMHRNDAQKCVPSPLLDVIDFIGDVFETSNWQRKIANNKKLLEDVFKKIATKEKMDEVKGYVAPLV